MNKEEFFKFIGTPYREQYHFSPVVNWNNDPNGLCWFKGYYHLFYQLNPFGQEWNNMYWGTCSKQGYGALDTSSGCVRASGRNPG